MFNIYPGQGVGFSPSKQIAFGLGAWGVTTIITGLKEILRITSFINRILTLESKVWR